MSRAPERLLELDDMFRLRLVSDPQLASGGRRLAYVVARLDRDADTTIEEIVVAGLDTGQERHSGLGGHRAGRPRWSPDGSRLALLSDASGTVPPGAAQPEVGQRGPVQPGPVQPAPAQPGAAQPGPAQLWLWAPGAGPPRQLTSYGEQVVDLDWSPDGCKIALTCVSTTRLDGPPGAVWQHGPVWLDGQPGPAAQRLTVRVVTADGQPLWAVPAGRGDAWLPRWSPDSARLAFLRAGDGQDEPGGGPRLWLTGGPDTRARPVSPPGSAVSAVTWNPSGDDIAYLAARPGDTADLDCRLFRCAADGTGSPVELAAGWDRSLGSTVRSDDGRGGGPPALAWSAHTGRIYFPVADGGRGALGWADPGGQGHGYLLGGDRACLDPSLDPSGRVLAFVSTGPADPGNVHLTDLADLSGSTTTTTTTSTTTSGPASQRRQGGERRVTDANPWLSGVRLAQVRPVTAQSGDGGRVEGWITALNAVDHDRRPVVVSVHGGPHYPAGWRFSFEAQRLAARGFAVLSGNPRGSGGYGRRFAAAIRGGWGSGDLADVDALIDACAAVPDVDAGRAAITGVSYGGYLTMRAITRSARFLAAISENGISNLLAQWGAEPDAGAWLAAELGGPPWARPDAYTAASPIAAADRITTPLLLIHAELDRNCPIAQSEQMFAALRWLGRDVEFLRLQGEGHLMNLVGRPSRRLARAQAVDRWLDRYLAPNAPA